MTTTLGYFYCPKCKTDTNHKTENGKLSCLKCEKKARERKEKAAQKKLNNN